MAGSYLILGATYAFAAAVQPGPLLAYLISRTMIEGWRRTLPAAFAPLLSDIPIILLVLLILSRFPPAVIPVLRLVGGFFLLYLAAGACRNFRHYREGFRGRADSVGRTLAEGVLVNLLNPNPYLGWTLVMGPLLLQVWRRSPADGLALLAVFYGILVTTTAAVLLLFGGAARTFGPGIARSLVGISALALGAFGLYQIGSGLVSLQLGP